ncbi:MAG: ComEC/Rec2 family competence protein [Bacteroidota bacterium]
MKTHNSPLFPLFLLWIGGIFLYHYFPFPVWPYLLSLLFLSSFLIKHKGLKKNPYSAYLISLILAIMMILTGAQRMEIPTLIPPRMELEEINCQQNHLKGTLIKAPKHSPYGSKVWFEVEFLWQNHEWIPVKGKVMLHFPKGDAIVYSAFDELEVWGFVSTLQSPFPSYQSYLNSKGLTHVIYAQQYLKHGHSSSLKAHFSRFQMIISEKLESYFSKERNASVYKAMMLGDKTDLGREDRALFATAGLSHVLAISGMHVGIIFLILDKVLFFLLYLPYGHKLKQLLMIMLLLAFGLLSGGGPAVMRASMMLSMLLIARLLYKRNSILNVLGFIGMSQLMIDPHQLFDLGFQLSYLAVSALIILFPLWEKSMGHEQSWKNILSSWIGISLIATAVTAPLIWVHFGSFPTYFLLSNVLSGLLVVVIVWIGFMLVMTCWLEALANLLADLAELLMDTLFELLTWIHSLPLAVIDPQNLSWMTAGIVLVEVSIGLLLVGLLNGRIKLPSLQGLSLNGQNRSEPLSS